jgi:hypothetical protein
MAAPSRLRGHAHCIVRMVHNPLLGEPTDLNPGAGRADMSHPDPPTGDPKPARVPRDNTPGSAAAADRRGLAVP